MKAHEDTIISYGCGEAQFEYRFRDQVVVPGSLPRIESEPMRGAVVGILAEVSEGGIPQVDFPENPFGCAVPARVLENVKADVKGSSVVLIFEREEAASPIIVGVLQSGLCAASCAERVLEVESDGEKLTVSAEKELILRCGKSSITLTPAGKILICGQYILSRSSGVNRIQGGSVQIN